MSQFTESNGLALAFMAIFLLAGIIIAQLFSGALP